jgi:predicted peroxiredoxin
VEIVHVASLLSQCLRSEHNVQIYLLGEAVSLMRSAVAKAVVPVGWPPLAEALSKATANKVQIMPAAPVRGLAP